MLTSTALVLLMIPGVGYVNRSQSVQHAHTDNPTHRLTHTSVSFTLVSHDVNQHYP